MEVGGIGGLDLAHGVQQTAYKKSIPQGAHNSKHEDGPQVLNERTDGQEIAGIQDDWRQQAEEEQPGVQHWGDRFPRQLDEAPHQQANHNQKTALWHNAGQLRNQVKPWGKRQKKRDRIKTQRIKEERKGKGMRTPLGLYLTVC